MLRKDENGRVLINKTHTPLLLDRVRQTLSESDDPLSSHEPTLERGRIPPKADPPLAEKQRS